jgi:hypothetical protein
MPRGRRKWSLHTVMHELDRYKAKLVEPVDKRIKALRAELAHAEKIRHELVGKAAEYASSGPKIVKATVYGGKRRAPRGSMKAHAERIVKFIEDHKPTPHTAEQLKKAVKGLPKQIQISVLLKPHVKAKRIKMKGKRRSATYHAA